MSDKSIIVIRSTTNGLPPIETDGKILQGWIKTGEKNMSRRNPPYTISLWEKKMNYSHITPNRYKIVEKGYTPLHDINTWFGEIENGFIIEDSSFSVSDIMNALDEIHKADARTLTDIGEFEEKGGKKRTKTNRVKRSRTKKKSHKKTTTQ